MAQLGKIDTAKLNEMKDVFSKRLRGFRTLIPILTFTLIYRFVSPVAITPIANAISDWASKKKPNKPEGTSKNA